MDDRPVPIQPPHDDAEPGAGAPRAAPGGGDDGADDAELVADVPTGPTVGAGERADGSDGPVAGPVAGPGSGVADHEDGAAAPAAQTGRGRWSARIHRWGPRARIVLFALAGAASAVVVAGRVSAEVGPFDTTVGVGPSLFGRTVVHVAPLGTIELDTHDWPIALDLRVEELGLDEAERIANNPQVIDDLGDDVADDIRAAVVRLAVRCVILGLIGGMVGAAAARLRWRSAVTGLATASVLVVATGAGAALTFNTDAVAEPRYTGLLSRAPAAVGDVERIIERFGQYREQLSDLVGNVVTLYLAGENLPTFAPADDTIRVLHVSDIHLNPQAFDLMEQVKDQFAIDVIVDTGDIVDWGTPPESQLMGQIGELGVPYVYVRGNHDSRATQAAVADQPNAVVLDGDAAEVAGLRFWGIGDPRYTPDKDQPTGGESERERADAFAPEVAEELDRDQPPAVDVALVHDPRMAADLGGDVPLVLAGHRHEPSQQRIEPVEDDGEGDAAGDQEGASSTTTTEPPQETILLVEGSTGGAGLRGLQGEEPKPLQASVLYFDPDTHQLLAYDRLSVKGLGETGATIDRHILAQGTGNTNGGAAAGSGAQPDDAILSPSHYLDRLLGL